MKKIMMFLAVACVAGLAHAAAVNWSATNVYSANDSTAKANGVVGYLFLADQVSLDDAKAAATAGGDQLANLINTYGLTKETSTSAGKFVAVTSGNSTLPDSYNGTSASAYAIIFDSSDYTTATKFFVTATATTTINAVGNSTFAFGTQATASTAAGAYSSVGGTPEPTSALLLLIGGAMLALRRKQK